MASSTPIVVFDVGNVLLRWDARLIYRSLIPEPERLDWFMQNICTGDWNLEQDRGRSWEEGVALLVKQHPEWEREIRAFDESWHDSVPHTIADSVAVLEELKGQGEKVYAITNFSDEKFPIAQQRYESLRLFRGVVVSGAEGLLKPDAAIFALFCERYGLAPQRCLFVDDMAANVEGARAAGMSAALFVDPPTLRRDLAAAGFLV